MLTVLVTGSEGPKKKTSFWNLDDYIVNAIGMGLNATLQ
jgi:hypothetical protein